MLNSLVRGCVQVRGSVQKLNRGLERRSVLELNRGLERSSVLELNRGPERRSVLELNRGLERMSVLDLAQSLYHVTLPVHTNCRRRGGVGVGGLGGPPER